MLAAVLSDNPLLIGPLNSELGLEDLHDLFEIKMVDAHNRRAVRRHREREEKNK